MARGIVQCFLSANLAFGHDGLAELAKKNKIDVQKLEPGEYVVFINAKQDRVKVYAASNVIAYMKSNKGHKIDLKIIQEIPKVFEAKRSINYDAALRVAVTKALVQRKDRLKELNSLQVYRAAQASGVM